MDEKVLKQVQEFVTKIIADIGFTPESITVTGEENEERYDVQAIVAGTDFDLLIGYHGKNLEALHQIVVSYAKQLFPKDKKLSIFLDVGDYFGKQDEKLRKMIADAIQEVKLLDEPYEFQPMTPRQRRILHLEAEKQTGIRTESKGEGIDRRVVIYPANAA